MREDARSGLSKTPAGRPSGVVSRKPIAVSPRMFAPSDTVANDTVAILRVDYGHARAVAEQLRATGVAQAFGVETKPAPYGDRLNERERR